jgi:pseudouridine synthase
MKIKNEFESGIILDDELTLPAKIEQLESNVCKVTLHQGKYHQVKRMFEYFGYKVIELHREKFAFLTLGDLQEGEYRELTDEEVNHLKML